MDAFSYCVFGEEERREGVFFWIDGIDWKSCD